MLKPPYMNFPFPFYRKTPSYYGLNNFSTSNANSKSQNTSEDTRDFESKNKSNKNTDDYLFDLFGLKIYSDDILLVSLIYFLYSEGFKDDGLFIVLILLLLS